jgi:RNA polymerase sigma-70 factor, ECF subfamily
MGMLLEKAGHVVGALPPGDEQILALIRRIATGDPSALMSLYDGTSRLLFGLIMRVLGDRTSAEEALLDVYTQVWKQSASFNPEISPLEWLLTMARLGALSQPHWTQRDNAKKNLSRSTGDPAMTVARGRQNLARISLDSLAPAQRELLEWAYCSGLSCSEMAAQIGKPVGAVKTHIRLGLSKIGESVEAATGLEVESSDCNGGTK